MLTERLKKGPRTEAITAQPSSIGATVAGRGAQAWAVRLANGFVRLAGWRRWTIAGCLGLLAAVALPPIHALPLLIPAFTCLVWLLDGSRSTRSAFAVGWWFGFGHFVVGLYWIAEAFLVNAEHFAWMIPFAVFGLSAGLATFSGLATAVAYRTTAPGIARVLALGAAWAGAEWLRGHVLTGFPWNLMGYVWTASDAMLQVTAVTGIYGLGLVTVVAAGMPATLAASSGAASGRRGAWATTVIAAVLAAVWSGGLMRLSTAEMQPVTGVRLRIVQPNITQSEKWDGDKRAEHFARLMRLSTMPAKESVTHVIWPETAISFAPNHSDARPDVLALAAPPGGLVIAGALRVARQDDGEPKAWNSVVAIDVQGSIVAQYDKFHLVPFGEYVPMRDILPLDPIAAGPLDFSAGQGPKTLTLPGLPAVSPLICYEAIFPGDVTDPGQRPQWLLNVTNDAWFGRSAGPYQHFAIARVRAVEEGLPLVRAANTGISAVVDPYGRIQDQIYLGQQGVLDAPLPRGLKPATLYARYGDWILLAAIVFVAALAGLFNRVGKGRQSS